MGDSVKAHQVWGLGVYSVFRHPDVSLTNAIEVSHAPNVCFEHMITVALDNLGEITHVIDGVGAAATTNPHAVAKVNVFPAASAGCAP